MRTFSSLVGRKVLTESGLSLGRVHDLRGELGVSRLEVVTICVGRSGWFDRLGISSRKHSEVDWAAIVRIEGDRIVVRDP
jgi:sporulation protein YlmC with PRC-barrel domain